MKFALKRGCIILFSVLLFLASCGDADLFDTDKWSSKIEGWEPGVKGVVTQGTFSLWDLINQGKDSVIALGPDSTLFIQYLQEDIYSIDVKEVFRMPEENMSFALPPLPLEGAPVGEPLPGDITLTTENGLTTEASLEEIPAGCSLTKLVASAVFYYPKMDFAYYIEAEFPNIMTQNGEVLKLSKEVPAHTQLTEDLNSITLVLDDTKKVELKVSKIIVRKESILNSTVLRLTFGLNKLEFIQAVGRITADPIQIEEGKFDLDVDFLDEIGGEFKFAKPELNVIVRNKGIGVPLQVNATFDGQSSENVPLTLRLNSGAAPLRTLGNVTPNWVPDTLGFNYENSNIVDFLSLPPSGDITYQGWVVVNPEPEAEGVENVVYNDGQIILDAYVRIPFELSAERLTYKDTLDDIDIDQKYADKIVEGKIKITAINGLPLNVELPSLTLVDEVGETMVLNAVKNSQGLKANAEGVIEYNINREQAKFLGKTKNILLEAVASTPGNAVKVISAKAKLKFKLLLEAKAVIEDYDDF